MTAQQDLGCNTRKLTPAHGAGPNYKPGAPERASLLEPGIRGNKLVVTGRVLDQDCLPVAGALLDYWQADGEGHYDEVGYRLRGRQYTDAEGRYRLETVVPGGYGGRTPHIHIKAQAPNRPAISTELLFPRGPDDQRGPNYDPDLVVAVEATAEGQAAAFDFVLDTR